MAAPIRSSDYQNRLSTPALAGLAFLFCIAMTIAFWPGVGTWEVIQFTIQRKLPVMNDWKSPFIAAIYWASDDLFKSTGPILLLQQFLFWCGLALFVVSTFKKIWHQILFFMAVAILPPIWITEIMLWKEAWTLSFIALSIGSTFAFIRSRRTLFAGIALLSAVLLTATRHNALLLALPTFYIFAQAFADKTPAAKKSRRRMILIMVFTILVCATLGTNWMLNKWGKQRCHIWYHSLAWDLAAISLAENQIVIPHEFIKTGQDGSLEHLKKYFTYYNSDPLFFGKNAPLKLYGTAWTSCDERVPLDILLERWRDAILTHPGTYLRHRWLYLLHLLGIPQTSEHSSENKKAQEYYRIDSEFTATTNHSGLFEFIKGSPIYEALAVGFPSRGWLYMSVFFLSVLGLTVRAALINTYLWILWFAGCAYFVSFIAIGSGAVLRYLVVYAILGPAILAGRRLTRKPLQDDDLN